MILRVFARDDVAEADNDQTANDEENSQPLVDLQSPSEEGDREKAGEDDESTSEHLKARRASENETNVHQRGGRHVAESRRKEDERTEGGAAPNYKKREDIGEWPLSTKHPHHSYLSRASFHWCSPSSCSTGTCPCTRESRETRQRTSPPLEETDG